VFVIERSGKAVHLGGCGNPNQAVQLVNAALQESKISDPEITLIVPTKYVRRCVPEASIRFAAVAKPPPRTPSPA
jgi:hypothetical protein